MLSPNGQWARWILTWACGVLVFASSCAGERAAQNALTTEVIAAGTQTPTMAAQVPTVMATPTPSPTTGPIILSIWWPESFAPQDNNEALTVLSEQINAFQSAQSGVVVNLRLKKESDVGGIMATLLTASAVAPGALPDLTLIRRHDLLDAVQARLIYPLEGKISSAVVGDLYDPALQLGQVDGVLYGVPYMVEVQHTAYRPSQELINSWSFADVLAKEISFVFPAGQTDGVNTVFLAQYIDAGGTLPGDGSVNEQALLDVLSFYERALAAGIVNPSVVNYTTPASYTDLLLSGGADAGVVSSTTYLQVLQADLAFAPIPTVSGSLISELDGWIWVLTTSSTDRQVLAAQFLNWMLNANRQGQFSEALRMLPSQRTALQQWESTPYATFARDLLNRSILPLPSSDAAVRAMQNALIAVLTGQSTAEKATEAVVSQLQRAN